jgi:hypothetical protein
MHHHLEPPHFADRSPGVAGDHYVEYPGGLGRPVSIVVGIVLVLVLALALWTNATADEEPKFTEVGDCACTQ